MPQADPTEPTSSVGWSKGESKSTKERSRELQEGRGESKPKGPEVVRGVPRNV